MNYQSRNKVGMTMMEVLTTIAVFTLIFGAISSFILYFYQTNSYNIQQAFAISSARKGVEETVREIREATYSDEGAYPIVSAATSSVAFYSDIDKDFNVEKIRYFLDGTDLKRGETQATGTPLEYRQQDEIIKVVSDNVRNIEQAQDMFEYFNASSTEMTDLNILSGIRLIRINIIVNVEPNRGPNEFTLRSNAQLRNLKD